MFQKVKAKVRHFLLFILNLLILIKYKYCFLKTCLNMFQAKLKSMKVIIVEINKHCCLLAQSYQHLFAAVVDTPRKLGPCSLPNFFLYHRRESKINENIFIEGRTPHHVFRLNVSVNELNLMQRGQVLEILLMTEGLFSQILALFHCKLNAVTVHENVEAKIGFNVRTTLQLGRYFHKKELSDGIVPRGKGLNWQTFDYDVFASEVVSIELCESSSRKDISMLSVCMLYIEDGDVTVEVPPQCIYSHHFLVKGGMSHEDTQLPHCIVLFKILLWIFCLKLFLFVLCQSIYISS